MKKQEYITEFLFKLKRLIRVIMYTISMYLVTHLIVFFYLFPVGTTRITINHKHAARLKKQITGLLFQVIGKRLKVYGLDNLEKGKSYVIVSNYPGSYAGFALMNVFPEASILVHSFLSRVPMVGFLLKSTGATFVQYQKFGRTRHEIDDMLSSIGNKNIIILPEGGRSPNGLIREFKHGYIYILRHSYKDLLPITLSGFYSLKPSKRPHIDPDSDLEIFIHKPIKHSIIDSLDNQRILELTVETIRKSYKP